MKGLKFAMKIHYFQRYHEKENVSTANAMLLLSRLYHYSSVKFFTFLKSNYLSDDFNPEIEFILQEKGPDSIPDASITQNSFKIVVEAKLSDWFYSDQLCRHLNSFGDEKCNVLLTLAPEHMAGAKLAEFEAKLNAFNSTKSTRVIHINTTFEKMVNAIREVIDERDYEMQDILEDYLDYCINDGLIPVSDSWKYMRMQLAGETLKFNLDNNVYYNGADRAFRAHDYLGLYNKKSVRAIGKISARITAVETPEGIAYETEYGELTDERKEIIRLAMEDGSKEHGYDLKNYKHRYFFVEKFYETDYKKNSLYAPRGTRNFDLSEVLGTDKMPDTETIAELLKDKTWN